MFKPIKGYVGLYEVSDMGQIISLRFNKRKLLKPSRNKIGYIETVLINKDGKRRNEKWHRIIGKAFIPNPENKPCINHKNGIRDDNRLENLEWCTLKENSIHARDILKIKSPFPKGIVPKQLRYRLKFTKKQIMKIKKRLKDGEEGKKISIDYGVSDQTIYDIKNGRTWK